MLVYGHYDVQPVDPLDLWVRPPFEPRVENGRIYARGAADDKGQVHLHLWAARAWLETEGRLPINVRYVFEGEEESGSTNFDAWLEANRAPARRPTSRSSATPASSRATCRRSRSGLRGLMYAQIDVTGPDRGPPFGHVRRQRPEPGHRPGPDHRWRSSARTAPSNGARLLRRGPAAQRARSTTSSSGCRSTRPPSASTSACRSCSVSPTSAPGATRRPTDARRQRHLGRLPGRGHQDHHPGARARQDQLAPGAGHGPAAHVRTTARPRDGGRSRASTSTSS